MTQAVESPPQSGNGNLPARKQPTTLRDLLESRKQAIAEVLPKHLTADRLIKVAQVAVSRSPLLMKCSPMSILQCVMTSAQLGLDCSGVLGQAYMVPFFNGKTQQQEAQLIVGYRGYCELARRSGEIIDISAEVVYSDDEFFYEKGLEPKLVHRPKPDGEMNEETIVAAYMVATLKGGMKKFEVMLRKDIDKVRKSAKDSTSKYSPWVCWFSEMCRKSPIRRGIKTLPMSIELADAVELEDRYHQGLPQFVEQDTQAAGSRADVLAEKLKARRASAAEDESQVTDGDDDDSQDGGAQADEGAPAPVAEDFSDWPRVQSLLNELAMDSNVTSEGCKLGINLWLISLRKKGKPEATTPAERRALVEAIRQGRFDWSKGSIAPVADEAH